MRLRILVIGGVCLLMFSQKDLYAALSPGDHTLTITHQGRERSYIVYVPPQARTGKPLPVVLNFHGGGSNAAGQKAYTRMDQMVDREGFLAVYPDGTGRNNRIHTWNAGTCCGYAQIQHVDDVGFTLAVIDDLARLTPIDRTRVYATGLSNGAMMVYRLASEASDSIAAIAPVAGAMSLASFQPMRPIAIMHIHSIDDPRALYEGGFGPPFPATQQRVKHEPVAQTLTHWITYNGCSPTPEISETIRWRKKTSTEHTATKYTYGSCHAGVEVVHWKLTGAGHVWPGGIQDRFENVLGPSTEVINANEEIWRFFSRFSATR